jgi:multidrug efflux pump subunit AcrA (membrane-fusion protein)
VVRLPLRALRFRPPDRPAEPGEGPSVWRAGARDALERVPVKTGLRNDQWAELVEGALEPGAQVVVALAGAPLGDAPPAVSPFQPRRR